MSWRLDRNLRWALGVGLLLRLLPLAFWPTDQCIRDECTYIKIAERFVDGQGITASAGWLWAPGYPFLLGLLKATVGWAAGIVPFQILSAGVSAVFLYHLVGRLFPGNLRAQRLAAWLYLLSPHLIFFSIRLFSEVIYGTILLGLLLLLLRAREQGDGREEGGRGGLVTAAQVGVLAGICVLFRGVATYMVPIFMVGMVWGRWKARVAWAQGALIAAAAVCTVAPYSLYASDKFGAKVISDRTLGQMMYLGNNDFEPISFDYGNGHLSKRAFDRVKAEGREPCAARRDAMERDTCQTQAGIAWIKDNPGEFVARMPLRVAQMMTPHSLLTRHLRWDRWPGMPWILDEAIILWNAGWNLAVMALGAAAVTLRARSGGGVLVALVLLYHMAAISALAGLSRYRVPLEPLLMVYIAALVTDRAGTAALLREQRWRLGLLALVMAAVLPLALWFLPAGWPEWRHW